MNKVYVVSYASLTTTKLIGIFSTLEKAQKAYDEEYNKIIVNASDGWYHNEETISTDRYLELIDDIHEPKQHYQLQLTEEEVQ